MLPPTSLYVTGKAIAPRGPNGEVSMKAEGRATSQEALFSQLESLHVLQLTPPTHSGTVVGRTGPG